MFFRKLIAGTLSFLLLFSQASAFFPHALAAIEYKEGGYCDEYKTTLNFDRTKVPNNPLSDYITGLTPQKANLVLNTVKEDQLCMQIADTNRLISKTSDATRRAQLQSELESLEAQHLQVVDLLRALNLEEEAMLKAYDSLYALILPGDQKATKSFTDLFCQNFFRDECGD